MVRKGELVPESCELVGVVVNRCVALVTGSFITSQIERVGWVICFKTFEPRAKS